MPASCPRGGFFVAPTVFKVTPGHKIWREEVFGPVLSVLTFRTEAQALQLANDSEFGLGGARDFQRDWCDIGFMFWCNTQFKYAIFLIFHSSILLPLSFPAIYYTIVLVVDSSISQPA